MAADHRNPKTSDRYRESGYIASDFALVTTAKERGKPVKLIDDGFALAGDGDEIWGFIDTVDFAPAPGTSNYAQLGVQTGGRVIAAVVASGTTLAISDFVTAAANPALGTALTGGFPVVKKWAPTGSGTAGAPTEADVIAASVLKKWRVVSLRGGGGVQGTTVTIQHGPA